MKKPAHPTFPFNAEDWLSSRSVMAMTPAEEGAYIRLLASAWLEPDCGLPDDDEELARISRLGSEWPKSAARLRRMFRSHEGRLYNDRLLRPRVKREGREQAATAKQGDMVKYGRHVLLHPNDLAWLINNHGAIGADVAIEVLDEYLDADHRRLKKYSSHLGAIRSWVLDSDKFQKRKAKREEEAAAKQKVGHEEKCKKCGRKLSGGVCGPCGIDYTKRKKED